MQAKYMSYHYRSPQIFENDGSINAATIARAAITPAETEGYLSLINGKNSENDSIEVKATASTNWML